MDADVIVVGAGLRLNILSRKTLGGLHTDLDARVLQPSGAAAIG